MNAVRAALHIDDRPPLIALMGPTASGKTALAVEWARRFRARLISVDSALVYRGLDIGSAKPDAETLARAPHALVDIRDPHETYSAAEFRADALEAIRQSVAAGQVPLLVGGTGLYFRALLRGLAPMPEADAALRAQLEAEADRRGWPALHARLAQVDPEAAARIGSNDAQRIQRALEVWQLTGEPISHWQRISSAQPLPYRVLKLIVAPPERAVLHTRIAQRFDGMLAEGLIEEVRQLRADPRLHPDLPSMRAVGYRQVWEHLDRDEGLAMLRARGIAATRQLAKRQLTWLRSERDARWLDPLGQQSELDQAVSQFLARGDRQTS